MTIDQKIEKIYKLHEYDNQPGNKTDVKEFFAQERNQKINDIHRKLVLGISTTPVHDERDSGEATTQQYLAEQSQKYHEIKVVPRDTYAKGVANIKKKGQEPFTHEQNVEARVLDYEHKGNDSKLFSTWLDSITGTAYKAHTTKFKIQPNCAKLREINPEFNKSYLPVDYDTFQGVELDSDDPNVKYNQDLTREEAKVHTGHLVAMNNNKELWVNMVDIWFDKTGREKGMGFYVMKSPSEDQLRSVILDYDSLNSDVGADLNLGSSARFASNAQ